MSDSLDSVSKLKSALTAPTRGVVGIVDDLLLASCDRTIKLTWTSGGCLCEGIAQTQTPIEKSVMRAIIARLAALCNERNPNSVSPYRGVGMIDVATNPPTMVRIAFVNTPDVQSLDLGPAPDDASPTQGADFPAAKRPFDTQAHGLRTNGNRQAFLEAAELAKDE
jgi:hypothetical protein